MAKGSNQKAVRPYTDMCNIVGSEGSMGFRTALEVLVFGLISRPLPQEIRLSVCWHGAEAAAKFPLVLYAICNIQRSRSGVGPNFFIPAG